MYLNYNCIPEFNYSIFIKTSQALLKGENICANAIRKKISQSAPAPTNPAVRKVSAASVSPTTAQKVNYLVVFFQRMLKKHTIEALRDSYSYSGKVKNGRQSQITSRVN